MNRALLVSLPLVAASLSALPAPAFEPHWLRYPAISPDGTTIVFSYRGDLFRVPSSGGLAVPLTTHEAYDYQPVWSPDGSLLAFASDRHGSFDVFVMPAGGGPARRLTFNSADDRPSGFTSDSRSVLFASGRVDAASCTLFPRGGAVPELYRVPVDGGRAEMVLTTPALDARFNRAGNLLAYTDLPGLEDEWRKHDQSAFARDLWLWDPATGEHARLTDFVGDDRQPVWGPDQGSLYFLSERSGSFNVWRLELGGSPEPVQVTRHRGGPVRFLSASDAGDLCYAFDGDLYLKPAGAAEPSRIRVEMAGNDRRLSPVRQRAREDATELALSPTGKELAVVIRGEVFVTSTEHGVTRRITTTPEQERSVSFSPDARSLLYASERDGSWNVYRARLVRDEEPYFFNATLLEEEALLDSPAEEFQPRFSPDGTEVAYLEERTTLKVLNLASGETRVILPGDHNYSYVDGDQEYEWSPDGTRFLVTYLSAPQRWSFEVGMIDAKGEGPLVNLTRSGYEDYRPRWMGKGELMIWTSDRYGLRSHGGGLSEDDVWAMFFTRKGWDRFNLTEAELEILEEGEEGDTPDGEAGAGDKGEKKPGDAAAEKKKKGKRFEPKKVPPPVDVDLEGIEDRVARLTTHSSRLADAILTADGGQLLYLAKFEKGYDLWRSDHRKKEIKLLTKLDAKQAGSLQLDGDGKNVFLLADGKVVKVNVESGERKGVSLEPYLDLDPVAERAHLFEHVWRQMGKKFYDPGMHGVDWAGLKEAHARFLPDIDTNWDFAELLSEMLGELNASHTGAGHRPKREGADETAALGAFYDPAHAGPGLGVLEVIEGGPLVQDGSRIGPGTVIESVDGHAIAAGEDPDPLLNHRAGEPVLLGLLDPATGRLWQETVKPITPREQAELLYTRWVRTRREETDRLSGGRLGYVHIRGMSDPSFREIFAEILGRFADREGLVVDTRFNGGGNMVEALTSFLSGRVYARNAPRGQMLGEEPSYRWNRPSIVVMNEGNYSDAHCFPCAYTELGLGSTVGAPVPGTCTAVWWETLQDPSLYFGIPQVGVFTPANEVLENRQLEPDFPVEVDPALAATGRDQQLEKAVEVLLSQIDAAKG